jgi:integrase
MARPIRDVPWLDQRDGTYYVNWYEAPQTPAQKGRTRRLSLRAADADTAKARFAAFLAQGADVTLGTARNAGLTVRAALDLYWTEHVNPNVVDKVRQENAIRHLKAWFGDTQLAKIDIDECEAYAKARRDGLIGGGRRTPDKRGSDSTIKRELGVLQAASNHAIKRKRIVGELPTFWMPTEDRVEDEEVQFFTKEEVHLLFMTARGDLWDFIRMAYWTGARRASIETLEARQVNLALNRISLKKPGVKSTKKRKPIVPIFPQIRGIVERRLANAQHGYLFGKTVDFYRPFRQLCESIGLDDKFNPHMLRHSRATHMLMDGESIYKVAKLLGDTVSTVEKRYGHVSVEYLMERRK